MKNMDDLFKEGLENKGMPYQDAYWDSMASLLDQRMPVKQKGGFWYWAPVFLLVSVITLYGISVVWEKPEVQTYQPRPEIHRFQKTTSEPSKSDESSESFASLPKVKKSTPASKIKTPKPIVREIFEETVPFPSHRENAKPIFSHHDFTSADRGNDGKKSQGQPYSNRQKAELQWLKSVTHFSFVEQTNPFQPHEITSKNVKRKKAKLYVGILGNYVMPELKGKSLPYESWESVISPALQLSVRKNHVVITTGIQQLPLRIYTRYPMVSGTTTYDTSRVMVNKNYTQTPRGTRVALLSQRVDSTTTVQTNTECRDCQVKINYLNVPVLMGYSVGRNRLKVQLNAGIQLNLLSTSSGLYALNDATVQLDGKTVLKKADLASEDVLRKVNVSTGYGLGVNYSLHHRVTLNVQYFQWGSRQPIFLSEKQTLITRQLALGLNYCLGW